MAYESTSVTVERSQASIRELLRRYSADQFTFGEGTSLDGEHWGGVEFVHAGHIVRMRVPLKGPDDKAIKAKVERARTRSREDFVEEHYEQEARRVWRVIFHSLKARMVAVEERVETFEQAFLAHLVDPVSDRTLWEHIKPGIDAGALRLGGGGLRALTSGTSRIVDAEVVE